MAGLPIHQSAPRRFPAATLLLIAVNVVVFILTYVSPGTLVPGAVSPDDVYSELGAVPIAVVRMDKPWTIITSMFLHADIYHIAGNMLFLYLFGGPVESAMGSRRFLVFYFVSGLFAEFFHIASIALIPEQWLLTRYGLSPWVIPTVGASGAISGVMGAYLLFYPRARLSLLYFIAIIPIFITLPAWAYILIWFILQLYMGLMVLAGYTSPVAFWAHIGGFLAGLALAPYFMDPYIKKAIKMRIEGAAALDIYPYTTEIELDEAAEDSWVMRRREDDYYV